MGEVLRPFAEQDFAGLSELVTANEKLLRARGLETVPGVNYAQRSAWPWPGRRFGSRQESRDFAVVGADGDLAGAAFIIPELPLRRRRFASMPVDLRFARPFILVWTAESAEEELGEAYKELVERVPEMPIEVPEGKHNFIWTLEPKSAPDFVHGAIRAAGLKRVGSGRYSASEIPMGRPPLSTLYAMTRGDGATRHSRERELRTGEYDLPTGPISAHSNRPRETDEIRNRQGYPRNS